MTRLRRLGAGLAGGGVVAAGALALALPASAHAPTVTWSVPTTDGGTTARLEEPQRIAGTARHTGGVQSVGFALVTDGAGACRAAPGTPPATQPGGGDAVAFSFAASFPCNEIYEVEVTVTPSGAGGAHPVSRARLRIAVAHRPASPRGLAAEVPAGSAAAVVLRWDPVATTPDFAGYELRRALGDGPMQVLGSVQEAGFVDEGVTRGARYRYEVAASRPDPDGGLVYSAQSATASVEVPAATTTTSPAPGATGAGSSGSGPSTGSGPATGTTDGARRSAGLPPLQITRNGSAGAGTTRTGGGSTTATTVDTGYDEALPFGPDAGGDDEAGVEPTGGQQVVARVEVGDGDDRRETLALVAAGMATLMGSWALRLVLRAARLVAV